MSSLFSSPPSPPPIPTPPPAANPPTMASAAVGASGASQKARAAAAGALGGTITNQNGPAGLVEPASSAPRSLLG